MSNLVLKNIRKSYGTVGVLHGIDLEIASGEFVVFVGPSGCGKSTLLRMIAGLEEITDGEMILDGSLVNHVPPAKRGIAMVFQSYALYPHMSVYDNMAFGLKLAGTPKPELDRRVKQAAQMLQITPLLDRLPKQLSGGQRQRVAIGRAITRNPRLFLFDEPLSNLDAALRVATRVEIARLKDSMPGTTMIYVTHDQVEAMTLSDRIVVMNAGRVEQVGTPLELYHRPANLFVAGFIGSPAMNIVQGTIAATGASSEVHLPGGGIGRPVLTLPDSAMGSRASLGVRPEDLVLAKSGPVLFAGTVSMVEQLGEVTMTYVDIGQGEPVIAKLAGDVALNRGDLVQLGAPAEQLHLFDRHGQAFERPEHLTAAA
jgi:alpha-glucoside transport system ATP-binding protein